jgi:hypothetical protein
VKLRRIVGYPQLLPTSHERTRRAVDGFLREKKRAA